MSRNTDATCSLYEWQGFSLARPTNAAALHYLASIQSTHHTRMFYLLFSIRGSRLGFSLSKLPSKPKPTVSRVLGSGERTRVYQRPAKPEQSCTCSAFKSLKRGKRRLLSGCGSMTCAPGILLAGNGETSRIGILYAARMHAKCSTKQTWSIKK